MWSLRQSIFLKSLIRWIRFINSHFSFVVPFGEGRTRSKVSRFELRFQKHNQARTICTSGRRRIVVEVPEPRLRLAPRYQRIRVVVRRLNRSVWARKLHRFPYYLREVTVRTTKRSFYSSTTNCSANFCRRSAQPPIFPDLNWHRSMSYRHLRSPCWSTWCNSARTASSYATANELYECLRRWNFGWRSYSRQREPSPCSPPVCGYRATAGYSFCTRSYSAPTPRRFDYNQDPEWEVVKNSKNYDSNGHFCNDRRRFRQHLRPDRCCNGWPAECQVHLDFVARSYANVCWHFSAPKQICNLKFCRPMKQERDPEFRTQLSTFFLVIFTDNYMWDDWRY